MASLILGCCLVTACQVASDASIINDFSAHPQAAIAKYRRVWHAYPTSDVSDERFVVATQLMEWDNGSYASCYRFVIDHVRSEDGAYRLYALRALGSARGVESLEILFDAYRSGQGSAAFQARNSIKRRYESAKGVADLRGDQQYIEKRIAELRAAPVKARHE